MLPGSAEAAPSTITLRPGSIERGAHLPNPHFDAKTIHDGDVRIRVPFPQVEMLGRAGDAYVVRISDDDGGHPRVLRVERDGSRLTLERGNAAYESVLSRDGRRLLTVPQATEKRTVVRVIDTTSGDQVRRRTFRGLVSVLDADEGRAVLGGWMPNRTFWWNYASGDTQLINHRVGYHADIRANRVASFTRDPYDGGCSIMTSLRRAGALLRSCTEQVVAVSPNGRRVATVGIISDGPGPGEATVRRVSDGARVISYRAPYVFTRIWWENNTSLLLNTIGRHHTAVVRCAIADCDRATALSKAPRW